MSNNSAEGLRIVNGNLRAGLARLQPEVNSPCLLTPEDLADLCAMVSQAAGCRRSLASDGVSDGELEKEILEYRNSIEKLAQILPAVHGRLLTEKERLQSARSHVAATKAWAQASKDTL
jgi:hypothetical protein